MFVFPSAIAQNYLSSDTWIPNVLPVLFGLGAISAAKYPDGVLAEQSRRLRRLVLHLKPRRPGEEIGGDVSLPRTQVGSIDGAPRVAEHVS